MPMRSKRETIRRARKRKRQHYGKKKKPWMCRELGCTYERHPYKSEKVPPGYVVQRCKRCGEERVARVPRW